MDDDKIIFESYSAAEAYWYRNHAGDYLNPYHESIAFDKWFEECVKVDSDVILML